MKKLFCISLIAWLFVVGTADARKFTDPFEHEIEGDFVIDSLVYVIDDSEASVVGSLSYYRKSLIIPDEVTHGGVAYKVTKIAHGAFAPVPFVTFTLYKHFISVKIGNNVTEIESSAFKNCYIENLTIPPSVTSIGIEAFAYCAGLKVLSLNVPNIARSAFAYSSLVYLNILDGVKWMGNNAFIGCDQLEVTTIHCPELTDCSYPFEGCTGAVMIDHDIPPACSNMLCKSNFSTVTFSSGVTTVYDHNLSECPMLTGIYFGEDVSNIYIQSINGSPNIERFEMSEKNKNFSLYEGCIYTKNMQRLIAVPMACKMLRLHEDYRFTIYEFSHHTALQTIFAQNVKYTDLSNFNTEFATTEKYPMIILTSASNYAPIKTHMEGKNNVMVICNGANSSAIPEDVNLDGQVNSLDVLKVYKYMQAH